MERSEEAPRSWRPEPESSSASGGHLTPSLQTDEGRLEALATPLTASDAFPARGSEERTQVVPSAADRRDWPPGTGERTVVRRRTGPRRVRRTIRNVDPVSVLKLSLFFYAIFLVLWLLFVAMLYAIVDAAGLFDAIESFGEGFALGWDVDITLFDVERWAFLIGLVLAVIGALVNALLSLLYNIGSDLVGGVEMTFVEREI